MALRLTDLLRREHALVEHGLDALRSVADAVAEGHGSIDDARALLTFFREFGDRDHHEKEEAALFPALAARGIPTEDGAIGCMLREHEEARHLLADMNVALQGGLEDRETRELFREAARDYVLLVGQHMLRENHVLFEMAERVLPIEVNTKLGSERLTAHRDALAHFEPGILNLVRRVLSADDAA